MKYAAVFVIALSTLWYSCSSEEDPSGPGTTNDIIPALSVRAASTIELESDANISFEVTASPSNFTQEVSFQYTTEGLTAEPGVDFMMTSGTVTIPVGTRSVSVPITVFQDDEKELPERLRLTITNATNATIDQGFNIGVINDRDEGTRLDEDGYFTEASHYGYDLSWSDEFDGSVINEAFYSFDLGDGCPDLCGWGNEELQIYSNEAKNVFVGDGKLNIVATQEGDIEFHSARLTTKDKVEFQHGRIDIRARVPKGQGIWPAFWMLGANIDEVGWPACGEIDIMEAVGHEPLEVHGTAHWGPEGGPNQFKGGTFFNDEEFIEAFHVFTLLWEQNKITWYVDEEEYFTLSGADVGNSPYRFDNDFYFLFNVAVGGRWPGNPDETTVFPQTMEIDYIRVFQIN